MNNHSSSSENSQPQRSLRTRSPLISQSNDTSTQPNVQGTGPLHQLSRTGMSADELKHTGLYEPIPSSGSLPRSGSPSLHNSSSTHGDMAHPPPPSLAPLDFPWNQFPFPLSSYHNQFPEPQMISFPSLQQASDNPIDSMSYNIPSFSQDIDQTETERLVIAEEKRRRNTAASARFRVKKKQRTVNLERSISDLMGRAEDLEREATDLRRENGWLKEIVMLKGSRLAAVNLSNHTISETVGLSMGVHPQDTSSGKNPDDRDSEESSDEDSYKAKAARIKREKSKKK